MRTINAFVENVICNSCYYGYINKDNFGYAAFSGGMSLFIVASAQLVGYSSFNILSIFSMHNIASTNNKTGDIASPEPFGIKGITYK